MKINQKGFGVIALVLVLSVIGASIGAGIYIARSKAKDHKIDTPKITNFDECVSAGNPVMESYPEQCAANGQTFTKMQSQANTSTNEDRYLEIKEWGVRFKLTETNSDSYYIIRSDRPEHAYFSLISLKATDECAADKTSLAALTRFKEGDKEPYEDRTLLEMHPGSPKIGEYYYYVTGAQATCSDDEAVNAKSMLARQAYTELLPSLEPIPN